MKNSKQSRRVAREVFDFNLNFPIGTPVRYWTGAREGEGHVSKTRSIAQSLEGHTAVVWVEGHGGCIALSHVEPLEENVFVTICGELPKDPRARAAMNDLIQAAKKHCRDLKAGRL